VAAHGIQGARGQDRPAGDVHVLGYFEALDGQAVDGEQDIFVTAEEMSLVRHRRKVGKARHGEFGEADVVNIDIVDVLIARLEDRTGIGQVQAIVTFPVHLCRASGQGGHNESQECKVHRTKQAPERSGPGFAHTRKGKDPAPAALNESGLPKFST
jgi:hypothetical protein